MKTPSYDRQREPRAKPADRRQPPGARDGGAGGVLRALAVLALLLAVLALPLAACKGRTPAQSDTPDIADRPTPGPVASSKGTPTAPAPQDITPPVVDLQIETEGSVYPGSQVILSIQATDDGGVVACRLAIDGADTGWQESKSLPDGVLRYQWTAAEPGIYAIVGQARDGTGNVGESRQTLVVEALPSSTPAPATPAPATPTPVPTTTTPQPQAIAQGNINVRAGPGTDYPVLGTTQAQERFPITGRNPAGDWWQIDFKGRPGWLYGPLVAIQGGDEVPVVADILPEPASTPTPATAGLAPAPAPMGTVTYYETTVSLPTYPYQRYQSDGFNRAYNWPYRRFDRERFLAERPAPESRSYRLLVLENRYLKVSVLPELGGRVWQVIHRPTGANMFYQNAVVKPSSWGPAEQLGWLAVGGLEWNLPVVEHGYDWGTQWGYLPLQHSPNLASITVFTPRDGRWLNASVTISLRAGAASFEIEPTISNIGEQTLDFAYWHSAALAPGPGNRPGDALHFVVPGVSAGREMVVHSTGDARLPQAGQLFTWPLYNGVDYSRLGNWDQYLGFFEYPAALGPFAAVYDGRYDAGAVRVYPASVARGSKIFGLGWRSALGSDNYTDDSSAYVELHGGLAPTFDQSYRLPPGGSVTWREVWYPVHGIGDLSYANEVAAIHVQRTDRGIEVGFYPTRPLDGALAAVVEGVTLARVPVEIGPDAPFNGLLAPARLVPDQASIQVRFEDKAGYVLFTYDYRRSP